MNKKCPILRSFWGSAECMLSGDFVNKNMEATKINGYLINIGKMDATNCLIFDSGTCVSKNGELLPSH